MIQFYCCLGENVSYDLTHGHVRVFIWALSLNLEIVTYFKNGSFHGRRLVGTQVWGSHACCCSLLTSDSSLSMI